MNKQILRQAIPNIISNITIPLVGMVDIAIMGHMSATDDYTTADFLGAIALGTMIFNFIYWNFGFLRMSTGGFTAQAYGARDFKEVISILARGSLLGLLIALLLIALQQPIGMLSHTLSDASENINHLALQYFFIRILAAPATLGNYVFKGWFIGMQNSRMPMIIAIIVNVLNLVFNYLFVFVFGMGIEGVAWGTVIAQYGGWICCWILFYLYYRKLSK